MPQTTHGRYSKHLPTKLAALYSETEADDQLLSVRQDIRLLDAMLRANLQRLEYDEPTDSAQIWKLMRASVDALEDGILAQADSKVNAAIRAMRDVIDVRVAHFAAEEEIRAKIDQRRKLVETEQKITLQGERAISAEQLMLLMGLVLNVINNVVTDKQQRQQIIIGLEKVVSIGPD